MIFTKLRAKNFGCYYPQIDIEFKPKSGKNLWVFEGLTGAGKTTLFLTFIWGLYGDDGLEFHTKMRAGGPRNAIDMISRQALASGDSHMNVELHFSDKGKRYILQRFVQPKKSNIQYPSDYEELPRLKDELGREVDLPNERIKEMLPLDASQFFFFAGEVLQKYTEATTSETKNAIEKVLGVPEIRSAITDVKFYQRELTASIRENEGSSEELKAETRRLELLDDDTEKLNSELVEKKTKLGEITEKIPELEASLRGFEEVREFQVRRDERQRRMEFLMEEELKLQAEKYERVKKLPFLIARKYLHARFDKFREQIHLDSAEAGIRRSEPLVEAIGKLLESDRCWCGAPIGAHEKESLRKVHQIYRSQLEQFVEQAKHKTIPSIAELSEAVGYLNGLDADYDRVDRELKKNRVEIGDIESEIEKIDKLIKGAPVQKIRITKDQLDKSIELKGRLGAEISSIQSRLERDARAKDDARRRMATIQIQSKAVDAWRTKLNMAGQVVDALDFVLAKLIAEKKKIIESEATKTLRSIAAREVTWDKVSITDDYTIELYDKKGNLVPRTGLSDGQKEILALAFIGGLKNATDSSAPVVIDYLLGRLDLEYQDNVANGLSDFGEQVVYLVLDSELTDARRRALEKQSCQWYTIRKDAKTGASDIELS